MLERELRFDAFVAPSHPNDETPAFAPMFQQLNVHRDAWMEWVRRNKQGFDITRAAAIDRIGRPDHGPDLGTIISEVGALPDRSAPLSTGAE